jgi:outer membrane protein TolC
MGNRIDFSVSQQVDFPTAYIHKSRIRKIKVAQAELTYALVRQETLLRAQQLWIERLHLNQQERLLRTRIYQAEVIKDHFQEKLSSGEVGRLAFSQANLQLATLLNEHEQILNDITLNQLVLEEVSGGAEIRVTEMEFPLSASFHSDSLKQAYLQNPGLRLYLGNRDLKIAQKSLAISQVLPRLSAGYYSESVLDQHFKGFQVGISVPLWEHSNRVKRAKSDLLFAEADADRFILHQNRELQEKLDQRESLEFQLNQLQDALESVNQLEVLTVALEHGEISLSEYFYGSDFYFRNQQLLLEYKRDLLLKEAELLKIYL